MDKLKRANKKPTDLWVATFEKVKEHLEKNEILSKQVWSAAQVDTINTELPLLITTKPVVYLLNMSSKGYMTKKNKW